MSPHCQDAKRWEYQHLNYHCKAACLSYSCDVDKSHPTFTNLLITNFEMLGKNFPIHLIETSEQGYICYRLTHLE
jgi:hypothetical protein